MKQESKIVLYSVPVPSTSFSKEAYFDSSKPEPEIRYEFEEHGRIFFGGIAFQRLAAFRLYGEPYCSPWQIEDVYDTLVEIDNSEWVIELGVRSKGLAGNVKLRHYMICLDSVGCFEVAAAGWRQFIVSRDGE